MTTTRILLGAGTLALAVACTPPPRVEKLAHRSIDLQGRESEKVNFNVPEDTMSVFLHVDDGGREPMAVEKVYGPGGDVIYDRRSKRGDGRTLRQFYNKHAFTARIPASPGEQLTPGEYGVSFIRNRGMSKADVTVLGKIAKEQPEKVKLDMVLTFVGNPAGLNAQKARYDKVFQHAIRQMRDIYSDMGIEFGNVRYRDIGGRIGSLYRVIYVTSALDRVFELSEDNGALEFFFVEEIRGGQAGYIILGKAGGIPGPPGVAGSPNSGVAISLGGYKQRKNILGTTMAHEAGHYLGLFHTSEANGRTHDPLGDTAQCPASRDSNRDGHLSPYECRNRGASNFMFWHADPRATRTSSQQGWVVRGNPMTQNYEED